MVKSLIETYRTIKEATNVFRAQAAGLGAASAAPKPVDARAQRFPARPAASPSTSGTSTAFGGRPPPSDAINNLGRVSQKTEARPLTMGGSVPGRQVNSTMIAARSPNMQGRPAGSPTSAVTVDKKVTSTGNPNTAGGIAPPKPRIFPQSNGPMGTQLGRVNRIAPTGQAAMANAQGVRNTARTNDIKTAVANYAQTPKGQSINARKGNDLNGPSSNRVAPAAAPAMSPTLKAQMDGKITSKQPADQDIARRDARIQAIRRPAAPAMSPTLKAQMDGKITDKKPAEVAAAEPNGENLAAGIPPKPTLKPTRTAPQTQTQTQTKKPGVVKKPNASAKPARKPQAAGTQNNMTPAQRAIINRRVERGNARPGEKTIGLGIKTGKVTGSTARSKRPIGSSQLKEGMLNNKQLAEMIKTLYKKKLEEQNPTDLGSTDTGKKGREAETVSVNPTDNTPSATGSMNKNTNTKEIKEKKNATMG